MNSYDSGLVYNNAGSKVKFGTKFKTQGAECGYTKRKITEVESIVNQADKRKTAGISRWKSTPKWCRHQKQYFHSY